MNFIDIHGHYAWNIDDGIPNYESAYKALSIAKSENIVAIVATPHIVPGQHSVDDIDNIKQRIEELKRLASKFDIEIYSGSELFLNHDCLKSIQNDLFIPIGNTNYLLVEFDVRKQLGNSDEVEDYLYEIDIKGYIPIIAHVERYFRDKIDLNRIRSLINEGYVIQVNATSFLGVHGKTIKDNAYTLLNNGLIHVIATDTHSCENKRIPCLKQVFHLLSKDYDYQTLKTLLHDNPSQIINNQPIENIQGKRSFLDKLLKRR